MIYHGQTKTCYILPLHFAFFWIFPGEGVACGCVKVAGILCCLDSDVGMGRSSCCFNVGWGGEGRKETRMMVD